MGGLTFFKLNHFRDPLGCVLRDMLDTLERLRKLKSKQFQRMPTIDFASLHTTIRWSDLSCAHHNWRQLHGLNVMGKDIVEEERSSMEM